jgi:hypothetical protein
VSRLGRVQRVQPLAQQAAWPASARAASSFPLSPSLTTWPHESGAPPSSSRRRRHFPKITDAKSSSLSSPFLTRCAFGLYKQGCRAKPPHPTLSQCQPSSRDATAS